MLASFRSGHLYNFARFAFDDNISVFTKRGTLHRIGCGCPRFRRLEFFLVCHGKVSVKYNEKLNRFKLLYRADDVHCHISKSNSLYSYLLSGNTFSVSQYANYFMTHQSLSEILSSHTQLGNISQVRINLHRS